MQNKIVTLQPLLKTHFGILNGLAEDGIFQFFTDNLALDESLKSWIDKALSEQQAGTRLPFVILENATQQIAGSTSYGNISSKDQRLEIGWTWLGKKFQGTAINKNAKYLLLENAFEKIKCKRVEFKTDVLNKQSRRALQKIGAREEGVLRKHTKMHDNRWRDTIYYSILDEEWPQVKAMLLENL
jgi:RimJ/RimL family protein N-acetyltransferase